MTAPNAARAPAASTAATNTAVAVASTHGLARPQAQLSDALWAEHGTVYLTGTQALLRILLMQRTCDAAPRLDTRICLRC